MKSETFIEHLQNQNSDPNAPQCPQPQMKSLQMGKQKQVCERRGDIFKPFNGLWNPLCMLLPLLLSSWKEENFTPGMLWNPVGSMKSWALKGWTSIEKHVRKLGLTPVSRTIETKKANSELNITKGDSVEKSVVIYDMAVK